MSKSSKKVLPSPAPPTSSPSPSSSFSFSQFFSLSVVTAILSAGVSFSYAFYQHYQNHNHIRLSDSDMLEWTSQQDYLANYQCRDKYYLKIVNKDPLVIFIENFLQEGEADYLRNISAARMSQSMVAETAHNNVLSNVRTSSSSFLVKDEDAVVACIERRASKISQVPLIDCEPLQVVMYRPGQEYKAHFDYFPRHDLIDEMSKQSGQRYVTILAYMNDVEGGGGTGFPKLNLTIQPKRNAAVLWFNVGVDMIEDHRTLHAGLPVEKGEKWAINIWQRMKIPGWDSLESPPQAMNYSLTADG